MKNSRSLLLSVLSLLLASVLVLTTACAPKPQAPIKTHNQDTLLQDGTEDKLIAHNFIDGKCKYCDETTIFMQDPIGKTDIPKTEYEHQGEIVEIWYDTRSYYTEDYYDLEEPLYVKKRAFVYLPYGYDPDDKETKYNVFYLLHGSKLNEGYWFKRGTYENEVSPYTLGYGTENVLDYMYENNLAEKTIIVTPSLYADVEGYPIDGDDWSINDNFGKELINDLMPFVAENFNTYAASGSKEDLIAARDHHAYAGLSKGSGTSYASIWMYCLEYISYIGTYSNFTMDDQKIQAVIDTYKTKYSDYPVHYWYCTGGTDELSGDRAVNFPYLEYYNMVKDAAGLQDGCYVEQGDSSCYMLVNGTAHNYATWLTALYNTMLVFFR